MDCGKEEEKKDGLGQRATLAILPAAQPNAAGCLGCMRIGVGEELGRTRETEWWRFPLMPPLPPWPLSLQRLLQRFRLELLGDWGSRSRWQVAAGREACLGQDWVLICQRFLHAFIHSKDTVPAKTAGLLGDHSLGQGEAIAQRVRVC